MTSKHIGACKAIVAQSEPWRTLGEGVDFRRFILAKQAYVCVTKDRGSAAVAGFIVFTPEPIFARGGYLRALGVAPEARRQGVGRGLVSFAENRTVRQSRNFFLCVSSFNRKAQKFYMELGYERAGTLPDLVVTGKSEYIYWKRLRPAGRKQGEKNS